MTPAVAQLDHPGRFSRARFSGHYRGAPEISRLSCPGILGPEWAEASGCYSVYRARIRGDRAFRNRGSEKLALDTALGAASIPGNSAFRISAWQGGARRSRFLAIIRI
jgi:hypothetical protein